MLTRGVAASSEPPVPGRAPGISHHQIIWTAEARARPRAVLMVTVHGHSKARDSMGRDLDGRLSAAAHAAAARRTCTRHVGAYRMHSSYASARPTSRLELYEF